MFSASQHPGFASAVAEQHVATLRQQAADHQVARAAKSASAKHGEKASRRVVRFVRVFAHS